jgi:hypothetical protein
MNMNSETGLGVLIAVILTLPILSRWLKKMTRRWLRRVRKT